MKTQQIKTIKNVGLAITIISGLVVFSNGMSALMFTLLGFNTYENSEAKNLTSIEYAFNNLQYFLFVLVVIGILFLIGGIQLRKYKRWAKNLLLVLSIVLISLFTILLILGIYSAIINIEVVFALIPITLIWLVFSIPLVYLIRFLNKKEIQVHFN